MDQLVDLGEELDLANAAAPALQIEAGTERLAPRMMVADPAGNAPDLADRAEIERSAPDEWPNRLQEPPAQRQIARRRPAPNERGAFPWQRQRFIIGDCRVHRQYDWR